MRSIANDVEARFDVMLSKWLKGPKIENKESVQMSWQFEQSNLFLTMFWRDNEEGFKLQLLCPRMRYEREWRIVAGVIIDELIDAGATFATLGINQDRV